MKKLIGIFFLLFLVSCTNIYEYEICEQSNQDYSEMAQCNRVSVTPVQPSIETFNVCNTEGKCEKVPINRLLFKGGTDKKYCNAHYISSDYLDNWWNADELIDECEMPVGANMQFIFKQHNQTTYSHTGTIQLKIDIINYKSDNKALQIFTGGDNDNDNLPDSWIYCGNVDEINSRSPTKFIHCKGTNLKFVKLVNAPWNAGSLFIDNLEVLRTD